MKITGIIPARYESSRLPGKPLADICGKPMIWWVYQKVMCVKGIDSVYVATDDERVAEACDSYNIKYVMTSKNHTTHISRLHEVSEKIKSDLYLCVCGDEPLIETEIIEKAIPKEVNEEKVLVSALMREFCEPSEVVDPNNIKITTNKNDICIGLSRSPIPFPHKTILFKYKKIMGVECYNKKALDFFVKTEVGPLEKIEDITLLRYLENRIPIKFSLVSSIALSVDTQKDLEKVREILESIDK